MPPAPISPETLLRYGKLRALADHPATPATEAAAARRRLQAMTQELPDIEAQWIELQVTANRGSPQGIDWEGLWKGDPKALQALIQVLRAQQDILRGGRASATSSSRSPFGAALDNMIAAGMDWLTVQIVETTKEIPMARQKKDRHAKAEEAVEEEELQIEVTVNGKGHVVIKLDCPPEELEDLLKDRNARRDFMDELRGQVAALADNDDEEEEDDDSSSG